MLSGMSTAVLFTYLLGAILLIAGISNLGDFFAIKRKDSVLEGKVTKSVHKERRDDKNNLIQYYYELIVRYEEDRKIKDAFIKSDVQYLEGESVKMVRKRTTHKALAVWAITVASAAPRMPISSA